MKITQEERAQFRQLISDVGSVTDPHRRMIGVKVVPVEKSTLDRMEKSYMTLGRVGFWDKLKKLMDEVTEKP